MDVSALLLRNGEFVAFVYRGLVDDYARSAICSLAAKVIKGARKKFSKLMIKVGDREISAWDYYCYGLYKGNSAFRDKFVSDFIQLSVVKRIDDLSDEKRRLIEISACNLIDIDEHTILRREAVVSLVRQEVQTLALTYGRSLQQFMLGAPSHQLNTNGASPV